MEEQTSSESKELETAAPVVEQSAPQGELTLDNAPSGESGDDKATQDAASESEGGGRTLRLNRGGNGDDDAADNASASSDDTNDDNGGDNNSDNGNNGNGRRGRNRRQRQRRDQGRPADR